MVGEASLAGARAVVELGPGGGAFTPLILAGLDTEASYLGIEVNGAFVSELSERHPGTDFAEGSALHVREFLEERGRAACDRVVSGIPWMSLPREEREAMIAAVADVIEPGGRFVTFSYVPLDRLPRGRAFRDLLGRHFSQVRRTGVVTANLPPAFAYSCVR